MNPPTTFDVAATESYPPLLGSLQLAGGFTLLLVDCNQPVARQQLVARLQNDLGPDRLRHVHLADAIDDLLTAVVARTDPTYAGAVAVTGLETHLRSDARPDLSRAVINLNHSRDRYPRLFPRPLVLILPSYLVNAVAHGAPDFFSVHSGVFHFGPPGSDVTTLSRQATDGGIPSWDQMSAGNREQHLTDLERLLCELQARPPDQRDANSELKVLLGLSHQSKQMARYEQALDYLRQAEALSASSPRTAIAWRSTVLNNIGATLRETGDLAGALSHHVEAEKLNAIRYGEDHPMVARDSTNVASVLQDRGDHDGALIRYLKAERVDRATFGNDHPSVADDVNNIGFTLQAKGDVDGALRRYAEAERINRAAFGDVHPSVAVVVNNIGFALQAKGDYAGAIARYMDAEQIHRLLFGGEHPSVAYCLNNLGSALQSAGDLDGSLARYGEAERISRRVFGDDHPDVARSSNNIAFVLEQKGNLADAVSRYQSALRTFLKTLGPRATESAGVAMNLLVLGRDPFGIVEQIVGVGGAQALRGAVADIVDGTRPRPAICSAT